MNQPIWINNWLKKNDVRRGKSSDESNGRWWKSQWNRMTRGHRFTHGARREELGISDAIQVESAILHLWIRVNRPWNEKKVGERNVLLVVFSPVPVPVTEQKNDQGTLLIASFLFLKPSCFNFTGHYLFPYLGSMSLTYWYRLLWIWDLVELFWVRGPFCSLGKAGFAILFGCADLLSFGFYFIIGFSCILRLKNVLPLFGFTRL